MPKIDKAAYEAATEVSGDGFTQMEPGAYVCRIQAVRTEGTTRQGKWTADDKQYVLMVYDIADGVHAGKYSTDYFTDASGRIDADKDFMHSFYLSWKNLGFLKRRLKAFDESNAGFDSLAAFEADKWEMFVGKYIGLVLDGTVDTNDRGYDRWKFEVGDVVPIQAVYDGTARDAKITDNRGAKPSTAAAAYADIPFSVC